jgi:hypothetical protein
MQNHNLFYPNDSNPKNRPEAPSYKKRVENFFEDRKHSTFRLIYHSFLLNSLLKYFFFSFIKSCPEVYERENAVIWRNLSIPLLTEKILR